MERMYFEINEVTAKRAHDMMSMRDYVQGSKTAEYRSYVDEAYDLADEMAERNPQEAGRIYSLAEKYSRKMADNMNKSSSIGCMCPSVMIAGPSNFPTGRKEKQNRAFGKNIQEFNEIQEILNKIKKIGYGKEVISSGDKDAVEKLEKKLADLKDLQEKMKEANKAIRIKEIESGNARLKELGFTDEQISEIRTPNCFGVVGFPSYTLRNNNANIQRVEERLKTLKSFKCKGNEEVEFDGFKVVENTEIMRLQILFEDKPDAETRNLLKRFGFRWAPSQGAWQRQLTSNGRYALKQFLKEIKNGRSIENDK